METRKAAITAALNTDANVHNPNDLAKVLNYFNTQSAPH